MLRLLLLLVLTGSVGTLWAEPSIQVMGLFSGRVVLQVDGNRRLLKVGERSPEGVLLLDADSDGATIELAGQRRRLQLGSHIGSRYQAASQGSVTLWPDGSGMFYSVGRINGYTVDFLVDTGATRVAMNANEARRLGINYLLDGTPGMAETASGTTRVYHITLARIALGEIELTNIPAVVIDGQMPSKVLLGMSFLQRLTMEREGHSLLLRRKW